MKKFRVEALNARGRRLELYREADGEASLSRILAREGLFPVRIIPDSGKSSPGGRGRIGKKAVEEFTSSISLMLESGLSFRDALAVQARTGGKSRVKTLSAGFMEKIARGSSFSDALREAGRAFPPVYLGLVRVGERTGTLETVMKELSVYLEEERKIGEKIANALLYPALVLSVAFLGVIFLSVFILPRMAEMFSALGPESASKMGGMTSALRVSAAAALGVVVLAGAGTGSVFAVRGRVPLLELKLSRILLRLPVLGGFIIRKELLSFSFAMETLSSGSVPMEDALLEAAGVMKNAALSAEITRASEAVLRGTKLSAAVSESSFLPETLRMWLAIGEETGQADKVFRQLKTYYKRETEAFSARLMVLAEPAVTLLVGIVVILLVIGFIVPLFSLYGTALG